jgi:hypothetical protein
LAEPQLKEGVEGGREGPLDLLFVNALGAMCFVLVQIMPVAITDPTLTKKTKQATTLGRTKLLNGGRICHRKDTILLFDYYCKRIN